VEGKAAPGREIIVVASRMDLDDVSGRVLFPTPQVAPWLPFVRFAETVTTGRGNDSDVHSHRAEEVLNYVLEGRVEYVDDLDHHSVLDRGAVALFTARAEAHHNLLARPDPRSRWVSIVVAAPGTTPGPPHRVQIGTVPSPHVPADGVVERHLVGREAGVASPVGLECVEIEFLGDGRCACPVGTGRRAVAYPVEGGATVDGRTVAAGSGALIEDGSEVSVEARAGTRVLLASAPRSAA